MQFAKNYSTAKCKIYNLLQDLTIANNHLKQQSKYSIYFICFYCLFYLIMFVILYSNLYIVSHVVTDIKKISTYSELY